MANIDTEIDDGSRQEADDNLEGNRALPRVRREFIHTRYSRKEPNSSQNGDTDDPSVLLAWVSGD